MIRFLFVAIWGSLWMILEALFRSAGLFLPLTAFAVFYFSCTYGLKNGLIAAAVFGILLDGIYGQISLLSPVLLMTAVPFALLFRKNITNYSALLLPAVGGLLAIFIAPLHILNHSSIPALVALAPHLFISVLFSVLLLPALTTLSDQVCAPLALTRFAEILHRGTDVEME